MTFTMLYDARNRTNLDKLADNTRIAAYKWYQYCIENQIQILIYETIRTKAQQEENVRKGNSQTMRSYHLVGQALDWVLVDNKKNSLWNGYKTVTGMKVINYAKSIGFVSGHDWGWDSPHLQYEYKGYGTDTNGKIKGNGDELTMSQYNELKQIINKLQKEMDSKLTVAAKREVSSSHKDAWQWLTQQAITNGDNPQAYATREQFASLLKRYHDKFVK